MPDNLSPEDRTRTMRAVRSRNTTPERRFRAMLAGRRFTGWTVHPTDIIGNPDFVFVDQRIAIFIDGCFWHQCPHCQRPLPQTNHDYWLRKISRNVTRDEEHNRDLAAAGWIVIRIWEHELKNNQDLEPIAQRIHSALQMLHQIAAEEHARPPK